MALKLDPHLILGAYQSGFFPMADPDSGEIGWYRPDPRAILPLDSFHTSRSLQRRINKHDYEFRMNSDFQAVILACADREETWIDDQIIKSYTELHKLGFAHSAEIWVNKKLAGGLYGLAIGAAFFAESMFHIETDASKLALYYLVDRLNSQGFELLEVQFLTPHLKSLGAKEISGALYEKLLEKAIHKPTQL